MKRREDQTVSAAEKNTDVSLLRTYFVSLFSCLICCIMFLGTTYAWFAGNVVSTSNQIRTGMFHVQLFHKGVDIVKDPTHTVFSTKALAPGDSVIEEELTIKNAGQLHLRYQINLDIVKNDDKIAQHFTVRTKVGNGEWSAAKPLEDGFAVADAELAPGQEMDICVELELNTDAENVQGKELTVVLSLQAQQVLGNGGNG